MHVIFFSFFADILFIYDRVILIFTLFVTNCFSFPQIKRREKENGVFLIFGFRFYFRFSNQYSFSRKFLFIMKGWNRSAKSRSKI